MEGASAEAKAEMKEEYNKLESWSNDIDQRMNKVGDNLIDGWKDFKGDISKGWNSFAGKIKETLNTVERYFDPEGDLD